MSMLDLSNPDLDWVKLAEGMGVRGFRATTAERAYNSRHNHPTDPTYGEKCVNVYSP